ncbi:hypothetical protein [Metallibacterium scheffleri]
MQTRHSLAHGPRALVALLALLCGASTAAPAQQSPFTPQQWQQQQLLAARKSEQILAQAERIRGLLPQTLFLQARYDSDRDRAFRAIFGQYLSWYQTFIGDYIGAAHSFSIAQPLLADDAPSPRLAGQWRAVPALDALARLARGRKAIFLNENHSAPITRTLTVQLLARLRAEGYDTFAAETLYTGDMTALATRGYATDASGFYTREPVYAEMVRRALALGYRVIAYEAESDTQGDAREREQAENLYRRAFDGHPDARLVVNAGYAHIQKRGAYLDGHAMAWHFMRRSGIDPLCVEQTMLFAHLDTHEDHPWWTQVMQALRPTAPIIFESAASTPWTLRPGAYDVSVWFPPQQITDNRPTWLSLGGLRRSYRVAAIDYCPNALPCLLEARPLGAPHAAIPDDRVILRQADEISVLWLAPGRYRLSARDRDDTALRSINIRVDAEAPAATTKQPPPSPGA